MSKRILSLCLSFLMVFGLAFSVQAAVKDGTYEVESTGMSAGLKLAVTFAGGKITSVEVLSSNETPGIGDAAIARVPGEIVSNNSLKVDMVTGASLTSKGIIDGVKAAIEAAGGSVADFETELSAAEVERSEKSLEADIVIAGAGLSGLSAAITAAEAGASVILLEKSAMVGGSLALAGGNFMSVDSAVAKEYGVDDNMADTLTFWQWSAEQSVDKDSDFPDMERVTFLLGKVDGLLTWMKDHDVPFTRATPVDVNTVAKIYTEGRGAAVASKLEEKALEAGVTLLYETPATEIIMENGTAVGLKAQSATEDLTITAKKGVLLTTGGFGANPDLVAEWVPGYAGAKSSVAASNTGDGILMAEAVGAALYEKPWVMPAGLTLDPDVTANVADVSKLTYGLLANRALVNAEGKRFTNEYIGGAYAVLTNAVAADNSTVYYILDNSDQEVLASLEEGVSKKVILKGETLSDLAAQMNVSAENLEATIKAYDGYSQAGADDDFKKDAAYLTAYAQTGPYYAVKFIPALLGTMGGVVTDADGRVQTESGEVIPKLYAAGEMSNRSFYNQVYVGAASLSLYPISAQLAIADMLAE